MLLPHMHLSTLQWKICPIEDSQSSTVFILFMVDVHSFPNTGLIEIAYS